MLLGDTAGNKNIFFKQISIDHNTGQVSEDSTVFSNY
jgi:hypothetical protein